MEDQGIPNYFMTMMAHELKNIFVQICHASTCALERPDRRYIQDILEASQAGYRIVRDLQLLARPESIDYPLRSHSLRAIIDMINRVTSKPYLAIKLPEDLKIEADLSLLEAAIHQMCAIADNTSSKTYILNVSLVDGSNLQIKTKWDILKVPRDDGSRPINIGVQLLQKIAKVHNGRFEFSTGPKPFITLTLPLK